MDNSKNLNKKVTGKEQLSIPDSSKVVNKNLLLFNRRKDWQKSLPFYFDNKTHNFGGLGLNASFSLKVPLTVTDDLRLGKGPERDMTNRAAYSGVFPSNGEWFLILIQIEEGPFNKELLCSFDMSGNLIDYQIACNSVDVIANVESKLDTDLTFTQYIREFEGDSPVLPDREVYTYQRLDKTYRISSDGKFSLISTAMYKKKTVKATELDLTKVHIRLGNEEPL